MPSGHRSLHFDLQNGDWAQELKLPESPRHLDQVTLTSAAAWNARLAAAGTMFADLIYLPVSSTTQMSLTWGANNGRWGIGSGGSARTWYLRDNAPQMPSTDHAVSSVYHWAYGGSQRLSLPVSAPSQAVVGFLNLRNHDVEVRGVSGPYRCAAQQACVFAFDAEEGQWHARHGRARVQSAAHLPEPQQRWTDVVVGSLAEDIITPRMMQLPANGVDGDIYRLVNPTGDHYARVSSENTNLPGSVRVSRAGVTFRYEATQRRWIYQPN